MKKSLLFLVILLFMTTLWAVPSNSLGQITDDKDSSYTLEITDNKKTLYLDGKAISVTEQSQEGSTLIVTETNLEDKSLTKNVFVKGLLTSSEKTLSNGTVEKINYNYFEGKLTFCSFYSNSVPLKIVHFYRDPSQGNLISVNTIYGDEQELTTFGLDFIFNNNNFLSTPMQGVTLSSPTFEFDTDGNLSYEENGVTLIYSPEGLLFSEQSSDSLTSYVYSDSLLVEKSVTKGSQSTVTLYENGNAVKESNFGNEKLLNETVFSPQKIMTLYENDQAFARIWYDSGGLKVERIEYL